jgi:hypothetical protein
MLYAVISRPKRGKEHLFTLMVLVEATSQKAAIAKAIANRGLFDNTDPDYTKTTASPATAGSFFRF